MVNKVGANDGSLLARGACGVDRSRFGSGAGWNGGALGGRGGRAQREAALGRHGQVNGGCSGAAAISGSAKS